jgi:hypothetical protein
VPVRSTPVLRRGRAAAPRRCLAMLVRVGHFGRDEPRRIHDSSLMPASTVSMLPCCCWGGMGGGPGGMGTWPLGRWCCWMPEPWWACMARGGDACRLAAMDSANGDLATAVGSANRARAARAADTAGDTDGGRGRHDGREAAED